MKKKPLLILKQIASQSFENEIIIEVELREAIVCEIQIFL